mgnify:CR=1 FL=1
MSNDLDDTDLKLVDLLQKDGLQSMAELSKAIGVAPSTLNDRVKRLGRLGVITGTHAHVDPQALGLDLLAFIFVGWTDTAVETEFLARVAAAPRAVAPASPAAWARCATTTAAAPVVEEDEIIPGSVHLGEFQNHETSV